MRYCKSCKFITNYEYIYDEATLWEIPIGICNNPKSGDYKYRVNADDDNCSLIEEDDTTT
jgi:hypothetical protein